MKYSPMEHSYISTVKLGHSGGEKRRMWFDLETGGGQLRNNDVKGNNKQLRPQSNEYLNAVFRNSTGYISYHL